MSLTLQDQTRIASERSYLGQVATRCLLPIASGSGSLNAIQSRTHHRARDAMTFGVVIAWPNWRTQINGVGDTASGGVMTIRASIEYPAGTITPLTFNGSAMGVAQSGQTIFCDPVTLPVAIPRGAKFFIRSLATNTAGILFTQAGTTEPNGPDSGEYNASANGLTDKTVTGTISGSNDTWFFPVLILAPTTRPSFFLVGDSIGAGVQETFDDSASDVGVLARSLGQWFGYSNLCVSGDNLAAYMTTSANRRALLPFFSHVISQLGTNDFGAGAATVLSRIEALGALFAGKQRHVCTLTPRSSSSDSFATVANQTGDTTIIAINKGIRAGVMNWDGMIDLCSAIEAVPDTCKWDVTAGVVTTDGLHPKSVASQWIRRSRVINPGLFSVIP